MINQNGKLSCAGCLGHLYRT